MSPQSDLNKPVFFSSIFVIFLLLILGTAAPEVAQEFFGNIQSWIVSRGSWLYILSVALFLLFLSFIMCSRLGDIKLGPDHSDPEYTFSSWIAMLFSAGMGIGLIFYGVAEPVMHFTSPPTGDPQTAEAAREAMKITFFHWGLHAWAIYAVVALALAYFSYRHHLPLLPRSALYPLIGDKIYGWIGHAVDTFAVIGTLFGVATSLGLGVLQVNAGFAYLFNIPQTVAVQLILIAAITALATLSVVLGLDGGIKRLSNINMVLAVGMVLIVIALGPTAVIMKSFVQNTGSYLSELVYMTFNLYAYEPKEEWIGGWTLLYWGWWISWSPFVGMFIARVSRGRTIREFLIGVMFIPVLFAFLWFTAFGNTAIDAIAHHGATELSKAVGENVPVALFKFFEYLPFSTLLSVVGVILVITFFVSSSDSGSLVIDTLTSGGAAEPPIWQRVFWALLEGVVAAALLWAGGLQALQTMSIVSAFPIMIIMLLFCYCLFKALSHDYMLMSSVQTHSTSVQYSKAGVTWRERLGTIVNHPRSKEAQRFIGDIALPALEDMAEELRSQGLNASTQRVDEGRVRLVIKKEEVENFSYGIRLCHYQLPSYATGEHDEYYRAEVFLMQGGQQYDILGYTREQIIADAITQYEKHMHFLHLSTAENFDD